MLSRLLPDRFTVALLLTVGLATVLPCRGRVAEAFEVVTHGAIALLFFLHGAKLSRRAALGGVSHWRLQLVVLLSTFVLFPILGLALRPLYAPLLGEDLTLGVLLLCTLPSTVQSSIAFTAIARGNVSAAVFAASASSLLGIFFTPALVGLLLGAEGRGGMPSGAILAVVLQLLVPFLLGQVLQPRLGGWVHRHPLLVGAVDRGSILLVVYTAFSASVLQGLWREVPPLSLLALLAVCAILLALVLILVRGAARALGFDSADEITTVFCGSKKSLATGAPMAKILLAGQPLGALLLPLMVFHQLQLMVAAALAQRYARRT